jgi:choline dehydrogenase
MEGCSRGNEGEQTVSVETSDSGYDVLVLGGGAAGCVIASRLSEDPARRVCLVEAGPDYGAFADGRWPASLVDARVDGALTELAGGPVESHDWGFDGGLSASRAKVIGGCSAHNGCEVLRGSPADYDRWADDTGDPGWSYEALAPHLARAEATIRTRRSVVRSMSPIRRALLHSADEIGLPALSDLNAPNAIVGAGGIPVNAIGNLRWHAAFAYLDPARHRPNLTILARTLVDRVLIRDGRAVGAVVHGLDGERRLPADLVVLTAGAYGTPAILVRGGIGPAATLQALGTDVVSDVPGVGRNLLDHPYVLLRWRARPRLEAADGRNGRRESALSLSEIKWASPFAPRDSWDVTVGAWSGSLSDQRAHAPRDPAAGMAPAAMHALSRGEVVVRSSRPDVLPAIRHGFLTDPDGHDLAVLEAGVGFCREIATTWAWRWWAGEETDPGGDVTGPALRDWIRQHVAGTYHPCGTARMGRLTDAGAVTDSAGRVRGVESLRIADASLFPSIPSANIHISVLAASEAMAIRLAGP